MCQFNFNKTIIKNIGPISQNRISQRYAKTRVKSYRHSLHQMRLDFPSNTLYIYQKATLLNPIIDLLKLINEQFYQLLSI